MTIASIPGTAKEEIATLIPFIEPHLQWWSELKQYTISLKDNSISININLTDKKDRKKNDERDVFAVEKELIKDINFLTQEWYKVASAVQAWWPPQWKPVWVKLVSASSTQFNEMIALAKPMKNISKQQIEQENASHPLLPIHHDNLFCRLIKTNSISPDLHKHKQLLK